MDDGIGELLGLDPWQTRVVCSAIPLAKKVEVLFATERQLAAKPDKGRAKQLSTVKKQVHDLNGIRVKLAHYICDFEKDTLIIRHVVNPNSFKISDLRFSVEEVQGFCDQAVRAAHSIEQLIEGMVPFEHSLDFSDPRNSMFIAAVMI